MLIACPDCHRQYDVSHHPVGSKVRCSCNSLLEIREMAAHEPQRLRCGGCGGPFKNNESECGYCGHSVTLDALHLGSVCPECCARTAKDACFCMECGVELSPQALAPLPEHAHCPRCQGSMQCRSLGPVHVIECSSCAGLWLRPEIFKEFCTRAEAGRTHFPSSSAPMSQRGSTANLSIVTYLPCMTCDDLMVRRNFGGNSGVIIDVCRHHGIWLDHSELERVLKHVQNGGVQEARRREVMDLESRARAAQLNASTPRIYGGAPLVLDTPLGPDVSDALRWLGNAVRGLF